MGRLNDWPERLNEIVDDWRTRSFEWGASDCVQFCIACDRAMNGATRIKLRKYTTEAQAVRQIKRVGGAGLIEAADKLLDRVLIGNAGRGDLAAIDTKDGPALVIILGDCLVGMGPDGLVFPRFSAAIAAWGL